MTKFKIGDILEHTAPQYKSRFYIKVIDIESDEYTMKTLSIGNREINKGTYQMDISIVDKYYIHCSYYDTPLWKLLNGYQD